MNKYKVGQVVKNKKTKATRTITKVGKSLTYSSKKGAGKCLPETMRVWSTGQKSK